MTVREEISYVAWGVTKDTDRQWMCGKTKNAVTDKGTTVALKSSKFTKTRPVILAAMQTTDGSNTAGIRFKDLKVDSVHLRIEEEKSLDKEVSHTTEVVGYLAIWDHNINKEQVEESKTQHEKETEHYIQPFPLFDALIYVKTVKFTKNAVKYENELIASLHDDKAKAQKGYCQKVVTDMVKVSNQEICDGTSRNIGYYYGVVIPSAEANTFCFKTPVDFGKGGFTMWDGKIVN
jgi:peroxiredoxin